MGTGIQQFNNNIDLDFLCTCRSFYYSLSLGSSSYDLARSW